MSLLKEVEDYCKLNNINLKLEDSKVVYTPLDKCECYGYFDDETLTICIGKENKDFQELLAHEFSHAVQFFETPMFKNYYYEGSDPQVLIQLHYTNKIRVLDPEIFIKAIEIELDCEKRTVELIKKYNICDVDKYIKKANSYMYYYAMIFFFNKTLPNLYSEMALSVMPSELKESAKDYLSYDFCKYLLDQV